MRLNTICIALALVLLGGCTRSPGIAAERVQTVSVPVAVGCISGERPAEVAPLSRAYDAAAWAAFTPRQKAAAISAQALRHQSRAQALDAATGACR